MKSERMPRLIGGPLDGASTLATDQSIAGYLPESTTRLARYDRNADGDYVYVESFNAADAEKVDGEK